MRTDRRRGCRANRGDVWLQAKRDRGCVPHVDGIAQSQELRGERGDTRDDQCRFL